MCQHSRQVTVFYHVTLSIRPPENNLFLVLLLNKYIVMFFNITEGFVEVQVGVFRLIGSNILALPLKTSRFLPLFFNYNY